MTRRVTSPAAPTALRGCATLAICGLMALGGTATSATAATTAGAAPAPLLARAVAGYSTYVRREASALLGGTIRFSAALSHGETAKAKTLFGPVRRHYEAIEPVAESFGDLDPEIDARINDVANVSEWMGFHRIEQILWTKNTSRGTAAYGKKLVADVKELNRRIGTIVFTPPQLANGAVSLLNEVANSKITGEEDRYSHTDLSDFQGNLEGSRVAFEKLRPALQAGGNAALAKEIAARFQTVQKGLNAYRRHTPLGFAYYGALTARDRLRFAQQVDALAEPLSTVAALVAG
jgi:iron uptake system component EfeO